MITIDRTNDISVPFEETLGDYTIYIEENPDHWTGGYVWSVCSDDEILNEGLSFTSEDALGTAKLVISGL